ncbi:MAG: carbohydrate ABC transporter permease [Candidatus Lokiarchaeota archaeon]|nr:carbohydrate ABC transporter permease [Candidatus Harpocratesius repetitus]
MTEEIINDLNYINVSVNDQKFKTRPINFLVILIVMGLILIIGGFWQTETILWNRIKYGTGSLWKNNNPIYHRDQPDGDLSRVLRLLHMNYGIYFATLVVLTIVSIAIIGYVLKNKDWDDKMRMVSILGLIYTGIAIFTSFWINQSIKIIETIPDTVDKVQSGADWIRGDIGNYSEFMEISTLVFMFLYLAVFVMFAFNIIQNSPKKENILKIIRVLFLVILGGFLIYFINLIKLYFKEEANNNVILIWDIIGLSVVFGLIIVNFYKYFFHSNESKENFIQNSSQLIKMTPFYVVLIAYVIFSLFPVYLVIKVSLSSYQEILTGVSPGSPLYNLILNYSSVMFAVSSDEPSFSGALLRSFGLGLGTGLIGIMISVTSAYALARFKFKGNSFLTYLILTTQMFPGIILLLPQYVIWASLGFVDTFGGILLASAVGTTAYCTWMMKGYFETIPVDIEEAAIIDGTGRFGNFAKIAFPLARSGLVAVLIFTFLSSWQDFILARTLLRTPQNYTLPLLSDNYENAQDQAPFFELLAPYSILVALPVVLFFLFMQKDLAKGAVAGSVK